MKRINSIVFLSCLFILPVTAVDAISPNESVHLHTFKKDVSGDTVNEQISLKGYPLPGDSQFVHDVMLQISNEQTEQSIHIGSGYHPEVTAIQLEEDNPPVLFIQMQSSSENDTLKLSSMYTFNNNQIKSLDLPKLDYLETNKQAPFMVSFKTAPYERPISADLSDHQHKEALFTPSGTIKKNRSLWVDDHTEYNVLTLGNKPEVMLEGRTPIKVSNSHGPLIGYVKTLWKYTEDHKWSNVYTTWLTADNI